MATQPPQWQSTMQFTGERFIPDPDVDESHLATEHRVRYEFALQYVTNDDVVLDCASGAGYGSHALAQKARSVTGVDISSEAVVHAASTYAAPNLEYRLGNAERLDEFADGSFTFVTSFETIEHLRDQAAYLRNIRRVLRPSGTFILSMPNREFHRMAKLPSGVQNPYHINELSIDELSSLLDRFFPGYQLYGQNFYKPAPTGHLVQRLLLLANRLPGYRALRELLPLRWRNRVVETIGAAPKDHILPLDLSQGVPSNILAVCR